VRIRPDGKGIAGNPEASRRIPYLANLPHESKGRHEKKSYFLRNRSVRGKGKRGLESRAQQTLSGGDGIFSPAEKGAADFGQVNGSSSPVSSRKKGPWMLAPFCMEKPGKDLAC